MARDTVTLEYRSRPPGVPALFQAGWIGLLVLGTAAMVAAVAVFLAWVFYTHYWAVGHFRSDDEVYLFWGAGLYLMTGAAYFFCGLKLRECRAGPGRIAKWILAAHVAVTFPLGVRMLPIVEYQVGMAAVVGTLEVAAVALPVMVFVLLIGALRHLPRGAESAPEG